MAEKKRDISDRLSSLSIKDTDTPKPTKKQLRQRAKGKPMVFDQFAAVKAKSRLPQSRFRMTLMAQNPLTGKMEIAGGVPALHQCAWVKCGKVERKVNEFKRCTRCQVHFCSKECQEADHKSDKNAACKSVGAEIESLKVLYAQCKTCADSFAKHLGSGHYYADFSGCESCSVSLLFPQNE